MDDTQLLMEYARTGSDTAFARLVERHVDLVYAACVRRLRDPAAADDATQAVFIDLARRAGRLPDGTVVAGWLYKAAAYEAGRSNRARMIRRRHEATAAQRRPVSTVGTGAPMAEFDDAIDKALNRLRHPERVAIVLRFLQGRSLAEVAGEMRTTEEAARKRVSRGLDQLRQMLRPTGAAGATFGLPAVERALAEALHPAPDSVCAAAMNPATLAKIQSTAATTSSVTAALKGALSIMTTAKSTTTVGLGAAIVLFGAAAIVAVRGRPVPTWPGRSSAVAATVAQSAMTQQQFLTAYFPKGSEAIRRVPAPLEPNRIAWSKTRDLQLPDDCRIFASFTGPDARPAMQLEFAYGERTLGDILNRCADVPAWQLDAEAIPLSMVLGGDWAWRRDAPVEQRLVGLAKIVTAQSGHEVHFATRDEERECIAVRGHYKHTPLPGGADDGTVHLSGVSPGTLRASTAAYKTLDDVFRVVSQTERVSIADVDHQGEVPIRLITTATPTVSPEKPAQPAGHADALDRRGEPVQVRSRISLDELARQTGLTFTRERRATPVWVLLDAGGRPATGPATQP